MTGRFVLLHGQEIVGIMTLELSLLAGGLVAICMLWLCRPAVGSWHSLVGINCQYTHASTVPPNAVHGCVYCGVAAR